MNGVLDEIQKKTPIGTRIRVDNSSEWEQEVTGHQPSPDRLVVDMCNAKGNPRYIEFRAAEAQIEGNIIRQPGYSDVEILGTRD